LGRDWQLDREALTEPSHGDKARADEDAAAIDAVAALPDHYFELYTLAVDMADRISARRGIANSFFLSVNTGLAAFMGASNDLRWYVAASGIAFCVTWWALLKSYRDLNRAKFDIILPMEERLPVRVFGDEWDRLKASKPTSESGQSQRRRDALRAWTGKYRELGQVERIVPFVFGAMYVIELIRQATS
jgi:hypothetical protein